jgi:hypothetical protein
MDRVNQWLNLLAAAGIIVGLVFVVVELRQNTLATISSSSEALTSQSLDFFALGIDNEVLASALHKQETEQELSSFEQSQIRRHQYFNFRIFENAYLQYQRGFYDKSEWERYRRIIAGRFTNDPYAAQMWEKTKGYWTDEFQTEVNAIQISLAENRE